MGSWRESVRIVKGNGGNCPMPSKVTPLLSLIVVKTKIVD